METTLVEAVRPILTQFFSVCVQLWVSKINEEETISIPRKFVAKSAPANVPFASFTGVQVACKIILLNIYEIDIRKQPLIHFYVLCIALNSNIFIALT